MKKIWYLCIKYYIKTGLFFYSKKLRVVGAEKVPKKGAVLFAINHPNGLLDPLVVATSAPRVSHFLVRAAVFKKPLIKKLLATLNLMPIYRIRDGRNELSKNTEVFNDCFEILNKQQALMIFPEGSHDKRRTIRPISKGFTRIVFGALEKYPELKIHIVPVGLTYQKAGAYPSKIALHFGTPIPTHDYFNPQTPLDPKQIEALKKELSDQLKTLTVHIPEDENYEKTVLKLQKNGVDFTEVNKLNQALSEGSTPLLKKRVNFVKPLYYVILLNSILPWILWKIMARKIDEIEFIDTFRFALNITIFPLFYFLQAYLIFIFYGGELAGYYLLLSALSCLIYVKLSTTPAE